MNYTVLVLGVWCILQVIIAIWGLGMLNNKCQNLTLYTKLRTLLVTSAVTATVFFANLMCNVVCYEDHEETSIWVALFTVVSSIIVIIMEAQIRSDIDDCANNTDTYKMVLLYAGILPSIFPLLYGCWMVFVWFRDIKARRSVKARERAAGRELSRQQREKAKEEEEARRTAVAEERERQADAIRRERQAKADERMRQVRKERGEYTAEERVAMAKERQQKAVIAEAEKKVSDIQHQIEGSMDDKEITRLGGELEKAQKALQAAKSGEKSVQSKGFLWDL